MCCYRLLYCLLDETLKELFTIVLTKNTILSNQLLSKIDYFEYPKNKNRKNARCIDWTKNNQTFLSCHLISLLYVCLIYVSMRIQQRHLVYTFVGVRVSLLVKQFLKVWLKAYSLIKTISSLWPWRGLINQQFRTILSKV